MVWANAPCLPLAPSVAQRHACAGPGFASRSDDALKKLFGFERVTLFSMNKFLSPHFEKVEKKPDAPRSKAKRNTFHEVHSTYTYLHTSAPVLIMRWWCPGQAAIPRATRRRGKQYAESASSKTDSPLPLIVSSALFVVQVVKQLWAYIKQHQLQDPSNKQMIVCDPKLQEVRAKAYMFSSFLSSSAYCNRCLVL